MAIHQALRKGVSMAKNPNVRKKIKKGYNIVKQSTKAIDGAAALYKAIRNHPEWYSNYPLDGLTQLNFGSREALRGMASLRVGSFTRPSSPDSVFLTDLVIPITGREGGGFWEAMQILMNKLRAASGSNITYSIYDLAAYILNTRELVAAYAQAKRIILALRVTDAYDTDAPTKYALMASWANSGVAHLNDLTRNLASDTARMNRLTHVIQNMIPLNLDLHHRTAWMFSNIFADSTDAKFSTKMFVCPEIAIWSLDNPASPTKITRTATAYDVTLGNDILTSRITLIEQALATFMNEIQNSRIAGDILKAFGSAAFMPVLGIDESMRISPIYDVNALAQIQNMTLFRPAPIDTGPIVETSPSKTEILYDINSTGSQNYKPYGTAFNDYKIVNAPKDSVSPAEVISLTRLVTLGSEITREVEGVPTKFFLPTVCGSEIITAIAWLTEIGDTAGGYIKDFVVAPNNLYTNEIASCWAMDDYAPEVILSNNSGAILPMMDIGNWAIGSANDIGDYHSLAILSMLATPKDIREQSEFKFVL